MIQQKPLAGKDPKRLSEEGKKADVHQKEPVKADA